jgi:hypothetical protein
MKQNNFDKQTRWQVSPPVALGEKPTKPQNDYHTSSSHPWVTKVCAYVRQKIACDRVVCGENIVWQHCGYVSLSIFKLTAGTDKGTN